MRGTIGNGKSEITACRETGSGNREVLRDKNSRILGRFETDTETDSLLKENWHVTQPRSADNPDSTQAG